jgi:hypothetical protein
MYNLADIIRYNFDVGLDFDHDNQAALRRSNRE